MSFWSLMPYDPFNKVDNHGMLTEPLFLTAALYKFVDLPDFVDLQAPLQACCEANEVKGTLLLPKVVLHLHFVIELPAGLVQRG